MIAPNRRALLALLSLFVTVLLTACTAIPMSGPVQQGDVEEDDAALSLRYYPAGPTAGETPEEVVQGFLDAGTGMQNNFATAREYLTDQFAEAWNPRAGVLVTNGQASMRTTDKSHITVSVPVIGQLDSHGVYTEQLSAGAERLEFEVEQEGSEWRISRAPDGIVLLSQPFVDLFKSTSLVFFDPEHRYATTDLRWFPNDDRFATRAVTELLSGPANWLYPYSAVTTAFPFETRLLEDVSVVNGQATVDLSDEVSAAANPTDLSLMRLQLERTLTVLDGIDSVEMRVNGARIDAQLPSSDEVIITAEVNSLPLVFQNGEFGYLNSNQLALPNGAENVAHVFTRVKPIRGALSASRQMVTFLTNGGTYAMRFDDTEPVLVDDRGGQIEPALDNWDWVWTQSTSHTGLYLSHLDAEEGFEIPLPQQVAPNFISHQVSRDGTKLAVLFNGAEGVTLAVMPIIREHGEPMALGDPMLLSMPGADDTGSDVAWLDSNSIAMLVENGERVTEVRLYRVGGELTSLGTIPNAVQVAGSNSLSGLRVIDRQGVVYAPRGTRWQAYDTVVNFLFAQL